MVDSVLLLSGGVDSSTLAYSKRPDLAITINYGQTCAEAEVRAAGQICSELNVPHKVLEVDCSDLGAGQLAKSEQLDIAETPEWWPFRNQLIITISAMDAVKLNADELVVGSVRSDHEHADGRKEFYELLNALLLYQEGDLSVSTPAIDRRSEELVEESNVPLSLLGWTHSCHRSNKACGRCRGCVKRERVLDHIQD
jgi:7-cyano-7-deazaguanine synthase